MQSRCWDLARRKNQSPHNQIGLAVSVLDRTFEESGFLEMRFLFSSKIGPRGFLAGGFLAGGFLAGGFLIGGFLAGGFLAGGSILSRMATQSHEKDLPEGGCANLTFLVCCSCLD